jgi:spore germination cell wall hydrolase CwlJ-like protein
MKKIIAFLLLLPHLGYADQVLTRDERIIALTILGEARGEGKKGMFAVACVVQRRSWEKKITPAQVCLEEKQFSPWNGVDSQGNYRLKKESELYHLWESKQMMYARHLARCVNKENIVLMDVTNGANHFCNINANPYWAKGKKPVIIIGKHKFYKL